VKLCFAVSGISALSGVTATPIVGTVTTADVETAGLRADVAVTVTCKASTGAVAGAVYFVAVPLAVLVGDIVPHGAGEQVTDHITPLF